MDTYSVALGGTLGLSPPKPAVWEGQGSDQRGVMVIADGLFVARTIPVSSDGVCTRYWLKQNLRPPMTLRNPVGREAVIYPRGDNMTAVTDAKTTSIWVVG